MLLKFLLVFNEFIVTKRWVVQLGKVVVLVNVVNLVVQVQDF